MSATRQSTSVRGSGPEADSQNAAGSSGIGAAVDAVGYPRFSSAEMARRHDAMALEIEQAGVDELLLYGATRAGSAVQWMTQWPVTREAAALWSPGGGDPLLFVQFANHLENARELADGFEVRWGGNSTFETIADELRRRRAGRTVLGVIGPVPAAAARGLGDAGAELVFLDAAYQRLRQVKSAEELEWVRRGASLTDSALHVLAAEARPGLDEAELSALVESGYIGRGGTTLIHYFATTPMTAPRRRSPAQWPSTRRLQPGDVVACEISAAWWGYPGQVLRTFTVDAEPDARYRKLHEVATETFEAVAARVAPGATGEELQQAASVVEKAGLTTCDDVVHGFVGGYLPPVVPGGGRPPAHRGFVLAKGMTVVVQPNVVTPRTDAGVQTGELLLVTESGYERLHSFPPGMGRLSS